MSTQQTSSDRTRQTGREGGRTLDSILRALTVAVALLAFGLSAPMTFADHMRPPEESTSDCGAETDEVEGANASTQTQLAAQGGEALGVSGSDDSDQPTETESARPFDGRPW